MIASNLAANLGDTTVAKVEAIVDAHVRANDLEGASFWREIADAVRVVVRQGAVAANRPQKRRGSSSV